MVIHSVMPKCSLMEQPAQLRSCMPFERGYLECTAGPNGAVVIERIISTDPAAYLDQKLCPGAVFFGTLGKTQ